MPEPNGLILVLGSRSPRRLELLRAIVPAERILVVPPRSAEEPGFDDIHDWVGIERRLREIARAKCDDVVEQVGEGLLSTELRRGTEIEPDQPAGTTALGGPGRSPGTPRSPVAVIAADTVIVGRDADGKLHVLGQPPEIDDWADVVRRWFRDFYLGKTHVAATAVCVAAPDGRRAERVARSDVAFRADGARWLEWYLSTGEPRGKAGGYAIQEAGSLFVEKVEGSLSNVIGLPLAELLEMFDELRIDV